MARFTDDSRDRVRDAVDFVELVNARTELRKAGVRRYVGLCPFHEERSPSFGIDPVEKLYHCFGCGAGGDVFRFVMETESVGFGEALELLADRYNVQLERAEEDPRATQRRERRDRLHALLERTAAYYVRLLWESDEAAGARAYLQSRGLSEPVLREFRVGYSPSAWDRVCVASGRAGFTAGELLAAGVAQRSSRDGRLVDRFRGRLMFPWADARGRVLGFGARALEEGAQPKYLNSSEGEVFSKGRQVYGTHIARAEAARSGSVVLVEGYTDVIALHQAGIRNTVGQMGTALTEGQAAELAKLAPTVLLCLDADAAGRKAMMRAAEVIRGAGRSLEVRVVDLPVGADPADVVARDPEEMRRRLGQALPFASWRVRWVLDDADLGSAEGRDRALAEVAPVVRGLPPSVQRAELVQLIAGRLGLSESLTIEVLGNGAPSAAPRPVPTARRALDHREEAEHAFLALCIALPEPGAARLRADGVEELFSSAVVRRAAAHLREHLEAPSSGLPPEDPGLAALIAELVVRAGALEDAQPGELDRAGLMLELARLDRDINAARAAQAPVSDLAVERQRVLGELRRLARS